MELFHDSHDTAYRVPFGAVPTGGTVTLRLRVAGPVPEEVLVRCFGPQGETRLPMTEERREGETAFYCLRLPVGETPTLLWYDFIVRAGAAQWCYSNSPQGLGGVGQTTRSPAANSYQITVYDRDYQTPAWFRDRIMYQIFPDRFWGVHGPEGIPKKRPDYILHQDWYEPLAFARHPYEDGPACNDFYGGNLEGIRAKLPYLKELGVGVLYLNPIFEAYSNHRYDTGDYQRIDPILGTEETFRALCREAEALGIRIILDGVFSHTGTDSRYFNKYGYYGQGQGAWQDPGSPYRRWYQFTDYPAYQSWWGCSNLPNVNEMEPSYLDYILRDRDAVVKRWIREGAAGWRLDVADELPDQFIQILRRELKAEDPEAVLIGEVWEDASNKTAYGVQREYLLGRELDSVMNYPFKHMVLGFLTGTVDAQTVNRRFLSQMENYPPQALYSLMNILGTHDTMRIKSLLGGMGPDCGDARLSSQAEELAVKRQKLGVFFQMTFYGVPCIYYGDEVGMQGGADPYNRGVYPWRAVDPELRDWYRRLGQLRNRSLCLRRGWLEPLYAQGDVYVYLRRFRDGKDPLGGPGDGGAALCGVNRGTEPQTVALTLPGPDGGRWENLLEGGSFKEGRLTLPPLSAGLYMTEA